MILGLPDRHKGGENPKFCRALPSRQLAEGSFTNNDIAKVMTLLAMWGSSGFWAKLFQVTALHWQHCCWGQGSTPTPGILPPTHPCQDTGRSWQP